MVTIAFIVCLVGMIGVTAFGVLSVILGSEESPWEIGLIGMVAFLVVFAASAVLFVLNGGTQAMGKNPEPTKAVESQMVDDGEPQESEQPQAGDED